mmetsp:Transcript_15969/g.24169  ORF Transcript_15969/g.24169 Transcript_15969/m.24169 type:complete len:138 (+) Transcript_15969:109-522(+)
MRSRLWSHGRRSSPQALGRQTQAGGSKNDGHDIQIAPARPLFQQRQLVIGFGQMRETARVGGGAQPVGPIPFRQGVPKQKVRLGGSEDEPMPSLREPRSFGSIIVIQGSGPSPTAVGGTKKGPYQSPQGESQPHRRD